MPDFTDDELYCRHCQEYTLHSGHYTDHERDASSDYFVCSVCKWYYSGYNGKYNPPTETEMQ